MSTETPDPFGFEIKRPGEYWNSVFTEDWALGLPHQCDNWVIGYGTKAETIADAKRFRAELDEAIARLEAAS